MSHISQRPHLPPLEILPQTPPPAYQSPTQQTHKFGPLHISTSPSTSTPTQSSSSRVNISSPILREKETREVMMGGLVTPGSRRREVSGSSSSYFDDEEKGLMEGSIEVPGIVLTEPTPDTPPRTPSPPPKQILLLPPTSLPIPHPNMQVRRNSLITLTSIRAIVLLLLLAIGAWHLWGVSGWGDEDAVLSL